MQRVHQHLTRSLVLGAALVMPRLMASAADPVRSTGELTAQWWQWVLSIPVSDSPLLDETGAKAGVGQPYKGNKVFFLCGVFNVSGSAERTISVPSGTSFFFPAINAVWANDRGFGQPGLKPFNLTVPEIRAFMSSYLDNTTSDVKVDGIPRQVARVQSPPFTVRLPDNNVFGVPAGVYTPAVSDGYWSYVPPLPPGTHTIEFGGTNLNTGFTLNLKYNITVLP